MDEDVKKKISQYLATHEYLTLATVSADGSPLAATVGYVSEGATVYFATRRQTRKAQNVQANPTVSYTVDEAYDDWMKIQGVQMIGRAEVLRDEDEVNRVMGLFLAKYPQMASMPPDFEMLLVRVAPLSGYFLDNTAGFGHRDGVDF